MGASLLANILEVLADVWDVVISTLSSLVSAASRRERLGDSLQAGHAVRAQLTDDTRQELLHLLDFIVARNDEGVGLHRSLHLGVHEMDDGAIFLKHVHLLDARNAVAA